MKSDTAELNLRADSDLAESSHDQFSEMDLYNDLLVFSDLSSEEQEAAMTRPAPSSIIELSAQTPVEIIEPIAISESQQPIENDAFFFDTLKQPAIEEAAIEIAEERAARVIEEKVIEEKVIEEKVIEEKASEPPVFAPLQARAFDQSGSLDFNLAEILRVTGPLPSLSTKQAAASVLSVCPECGSSADTEEMFCITCGGLLEEAPAAAKAVLSCDDCGSIVESDEIFCPSCGSVMSSA